MKSKCVLGNCINDATKTFPLKKIGDRQIISIRLCNDCFIKILRLQTDKVKRELCVHEWHADKDTMKNFCVHCELFKEPSQEHIDHMEGKKNVRKR